LLRPEPRVDTPPPKGLPTGFGDGFGFGFGFGVGFGFGLGLGVGFGFVFGFGFGLGVGFGFFPPFLSFLSFINEPLRPRARAAA
jgi:hypothetical protein